MKILIIRVGAMGDVLHALPAVAALRTARPDWEIDWVVTPQWSPLLVNGEGKGPIVGRVHLAKTKMWKRAPASPATLRSIVGLRSALRKESYDLAVDMQGTLRSAVIGRMSGSGRLVGYSDPRERLAATFYKARRAGCRWSRRMWSCRMTSGRIFGQLRWWVIGGRACWRLVLDGRPSVGT